MKKSPQTRLALAGVTLAAAVVLASQTSVAQSAVNYFDETKTVTGYGTAICPAGYKLVGGGFRTIPADDYSTTFSNAYAITGSYASSATAWKAEGSKVHGTYYPSTGWRFTRGSFTPTAVAVCTR